MNKNIRFNIKGLSFQYSNKAPLIFKNYSFEFKVGKIYGVVGGNGTGKTTLFRLISQMLVSNGNQINLFDSTIGYLPAENQELAYGSHERFVKLILKNKYDSNWENIYTKYLNIFNIDKDITNDSLHSFSSGMLKKVMVGLLLAQDFDIYILDEPLILLDEKSQIKLIEHLKILKKAGKTILVSSHDLTKIESIFDEVIKL